MTMSTQPSRSVDESSAFSSSLSRTQPLDTARYAAPVSHLYHNSPSATLVDFSTNPLTWPIDWYLAGPDEEIGDDEIGPPPMLATHAPPVVSNNSHPTPTRHDLDHSIPATPTGAWQMFFCSPPTPRLGRPLPPQPETPTPAPRLKHKRTTSSQVTGHALSINPSTLHNTITQHLTTNADKENANASPQLVSFSAPVAPTLRRSNRLAATVTKDQALAPSRKHSAPYRREPRSRISNGKQLPKGLANKSKQSKTKILRQQQSSSGGLP
ncbi:hypothetical protein MIND_00249700 [Mycena indigotica]|uniref:Uncharacterized protein n=1 Tax=Mycena indigotica TaxID=2126181 RepID=A0A8H6T7T0_9AGAR|nr:uncharacterized protein MIND_00249700 [Mycena indigotica]KAF7312364.1 hypothetical protein MIND_00249700 [Mycena indigotica]